VSFQFGGYSVDVDRRELRRGAELIDIGPQVFDLLVYLIRNRDRVVSKDDLLDVVWEGRIVSESTLTSRINAVRHAIGDTGADQTLIKTIARKGFRFIGEVEEKKRPFRKLRRAASRWLPGDCARRFTSVLHPTGCASPTPPSVRGLRW
jgi:DNA-binding winged helix-turn-helix (wHTH) protein